MFSVCWIACTDQQRDFFVVSLLIFSFQILEEFETDDGVSYWFDRRTGDTFWERPLSEEEKVIITYQKRCPYPSSITDKIISFSLGIGVLSLVLVIFSIDNENHTLETFWERSDCEKKSLKVAAIFPSTSWEGCFCS